MPPASNDEQFKFLISCIRYSNNGKVDFGQVAKECKIVSKGAAAKRYERMMKAHGIASNAASIKPAPRSIKTDRRESNGPTSKKRKTGAYVEDTTDADDDEGFSDVKPESSTNSERLRVKEEDKANLVLDQNSDLVDYYQNSDAPYDEAPTSSSDSWSRYPYAESPPGYATPAGEAYSTQSPNGYGFSDYVSPGIPNYHSQEQALYSPQTLGHSDSPLVVE
ncbi:hypothetical protein B7494_g5525 [Chlorociboria aeruginascens]|nr:hypothetical protein B7494_g5525 [Chlorociboria aeruginascens]